MRAVLFALAFLGWLWSVGRTEGAPPRCLDPETNDVFPVANGLSEEEFFGGRLPSIDYDDKHHPTGLTWGEMPAAWEARCEQIGLFRDNPIYRCTYRKRDKPADSRPAFDLVVYGYAVPKGGSRVVWPFFIAPVDDDTNADCEDYFTSSPREPFALTINYTFKGTGAAYYYYGFLFDSLGAFLRRRSEGGHHHPETKYTYDRAGKVVSTKSSGPE